MRNDALAVEMCSNTSTYCGCTACIPHGEDNHKTVCRNRYNGKCEGAAIYNNTCTLVINDTEPEFFTIISAEALD